MHYRKKRSERHVFHHRHHEAGILAKIAGLFTARGYNIESLTMADISLNHEDQPYHHCHQRPATDHRPESASRLGCPGPRVTDFDRERPVRRAQAGAGQVAGEVNTAVKPHRGHFPRQRLWIRPATSFIFEITGPTDKISTGVGLMRGQLVEVAAPA